MLALLGCGPEGTQQMPVEVALPEKPRVEVATQRVVPDDVPFLLNGENRLRIFGTEEEAFSVYPRPRGGFDFFEEPPIEGDEYVAKGWQTSKEAFGVVLLRNRVVLALYTLDGSEVTSAPEKVQKYTEAFGRDPEIVPGDPAGYWFWESGEVRLMICSSRDSKNQDQMVIAFGDGDVMDALRMSQIAARQDATEARAKLNELIESPAP